MKIQQQIYGFFLLVCLSATNLYTMAPDANGSTDDKKYHPRDHRTNYAQKKWRKIVKKTQTQATPADTDNNTFNQVDLKKVKQEPLDLPVLMPQPAIFTLENSSPEPITEAGWHSIYEKIKTILLITDDQLQYLHYCPTCVNTQTNGFFYSNNPIELCLTCIQMMVSLPPAHMIAGYFLCKKCPEAVSITKMKLTNQTPLDRSMINHLASKHPDIANPSAQKIVECFTMKAQVEHHDSISISYLPTGPNVKINPRYAHLVHVVGK